MDARFACACVCVCLCVCVCVCACSTTTNTFCPFSSGTTLVPAAFILLDYNSVSAVVQYGMVATPNGGPAMSVTYDHLQPNMWRSGPTYGFRRHKFARMQIIMDHVFSRSKSMPGATDLGRARGAALAMDAGCKASGRTFKMWAESLKVQSTGRKVGRPRNFGS